jgi:hypothetical protein
MADEVVENIEHVRRGYWLFGDIVRVDPVTNPQVPQPDNRRWMVLVPANTSANRQWTFVSLGWEPIISNWSSTYGFVRVEP